MTWTSKRDVISTIQGSADQTIKIAPLSSSSSAPRGIKITDAEGVSYFVEYRTDSGLDHIATVNPFHTQLGVTVLRDNPTAYQNHGSVVLDATPGGMFSQDYDRAVPVSGTFTTASDLTDIQVVSQDATGATIRVVNTGAPTAVPEKPAAPSAVRGNASAQVSWTAVSGNGSPVTGYTVTSSPGGITKTVAGDATTATVTGLTNGTDYTFTVKATNANGQSLASEPSNTVTPATVPGRPAAPSAVRGDKSAQVSWTPVSGNGSPVTGYTVTSTPGGFTKTVAGDATTATVTGLTNGTAYTFTVKATNAIGQSTASLPSNAVTPASAVLTFQAATQQVTEAVGTTQLVVTRSGNTSIPATVGYARTAGSAVPGDDFQLSPGTLEFAAGETSKSISLAVVNDTAREAAETIDVALSTVADGGQLGATSTERVTIAASDQQPDALISTASTTGFIGDNIYNTTATSQTKTVSARRSVTKTFYVKVANDGNVTNAFRLRGSAATAGSTVKYLNGTTVITTAMRSTAGWPLTLAAGSAKVVKMQITASSTAGFGTLKSAQVTATWTGDGTRSDVAKGTVTVAR